MGAVQPVYDRCKGYQKNLTKLAPHQRDPARHRRLKKYSSSAASIAHHVPVFSDAIFSLAPSTQRRRLQSPYEAVATAQAAVLSAQAALAQVEAASGAPRAPLSESEAVSSKAALANAAEAYAEAAKILNNAATTAPSVPVIYMGQIGDYEEAVKAAEGARGIT